MIWNTLLNTIVSFIVIYISLYFFFILSQCFSITTWNPATGPRHATVQLPRFTSWWPPAAGPCSTNRSPKSCVCAPSARPTPCVCLGCLGCEGWDGLVNVGYMFFFFMGETYGKTNCFFWSILVATEIMVEGYGFESNEGGGAKIMALGVWRMRSDWSYLTCRFLSFGPLSRSEPSPDPPIISHYYPLLWLENRVCWCLLLSSF